MTMKALEKEVETAQKSVSTDQYPMSIGELASMYRDGELILNPKYQRHYRWSNAQKSALIESILVGIPVPPIFCSEREDSKWEVVDGLQRVSTILEFMGALLDSDGNPMSPAPLNETQYLPALSGALWEKRTPMPAGAFALDSPTQIALKRAKLGIQIVKKTSAISTKYDLFQRLNSNGSPLTPQEYRSCLLAMIDEELLEALVELARRESFRTILRLDSEDTERQDDVDFVCRFLTHSRFELENRGQDVDEFISDSMRVLFEKQATWVRRALVTGAEVSDRLEKILGSDALRKIQDGKPVGRMGRVGFELIMVGLASNWPKLRSEKDEALFTRISTLWAAQEVALFSSPGTRGTDRLKKTVPFGKAWFAKP